MRHILIILDLQNTEINLQSWNMVIFQLVCHVHNGEHAFDSYYVFWNPHAYNIIIGTMDFQLRDGDMLEAMTTVTKNK